MEDKQRDTKVGDTSSLSFLLDDNLRESTATYRHQPVERKSGFTEQDLMSSHLHLKQRERESAGYQAGKKRLESILMKVTKDELQHQGVEEQGSLPGYLNMITTNESSSSSTKSTSGLVGVALTSLKQATKLDDDRFGSWSKELEDVKETVKEDDTKDDEALLMQLEPLEIIDQTERKQIIPPQNLHHPHTLLADTRKHFSGSHKLIKRIHYPRVSQLLYGSGDQRTYGTPTCLDKFKNFLVVGTSWGVIRIFSEDMQFQCLKLKPSDKTIPAHSGERMFSISAVDIHDKGDYLLAGYGSGLVVLWSLKTYRPGQYIRDIFYERITTLRFYSKTHLHAVAADLSGRIFILEFRKGAFGGFNLTRKRLIQNQKSAFFQVAPLWPHRNYPSRIDQFTTLALAAADSVSIVTIEPIARGVYTKILPRNNSGILQVPYLSWGRGCTPSDLQNQLPVLAFSHDKIIRLVKVSLQEGTKGGCEDDGYYISNFEIQNLVWLGESLLGALIKKAEIRVLYTGAFKKGYYKEQTVTKSFIEDEEEQGSLNSLFKIDLNYEKAISQHLSNAEDQAPFLDCWSVGVFGKTGKETESNSIEYQTYQDKIVSLHETVREIEEGSFLILGEKAISEVSLFEWTQFIELMKQKSGWLDALSMALEIYCGNKKGFTDVPQQRRFREASLRGVMKDYIRAFIETCITGMDYDLSYKNLVQTRSVKAAQFPDDIIARVAIEYCLSINEPGYLFSDLFKRFTDNHKENVLLKALEPFIISQRLKDIPLNQEFVNILLEYYTKPAAKDDLELAQLLEFILLSLDLESADPAILETILQKLEKMEMFRPCLYILTNTEPTDQELKFLRSKHFTNLLSMLFESLKLNTTLVADVNLLRDYAQNPSRRLSRTDDRKAMYDGFRLFWVLQKYLNLQKFPHGRMSTQNFELCCQSSMLWLFGSGISNIVAKDTQLITPSNFTGEQSQSIQTVDHLDRILAFSPELSFEVLVQFFEPDIVNAIQKLTEYKKIFSLNRIFELILKKCNALNLQNKFFTFFLPSIIRHKTDFTVSRDICLNGIKNLLLNYHESTLSLTQSEDDILALLQYKETKTLSDQELSTLIQMANITPFIKMRLMLCDLKEDYVKGLQISLGHERVKDKLFAWLDEVLTKLKKEDPGGEKKQQLDRKILESLRELVKLDTEQTVRLIDKWFSEWHQKVIDRLESVPELQLRYLEDFLTRKEDHISLLNGRIKDESSELKNFQKYLIRFVELLCRFEPKRVLHFVKKPYYSTKECLEVVIKHEVHDAAAMLFKKTGQFEESVREYLLFMQQLLPGLIGGMISRVFEEDHFGEKGQPDERVYIQCQERFAHALTKIAKICLQQKDDEVAPDLWFKALSGIFQMKEICRHWLGFADSEIFVQDQLLSAKRSVVNMQNQQSFSRPRARPNVVVNAMVDELVLVGAFFQNKIQWLIERMSTTVKLPIILKNIISRLAHLPYKEFKLLIENMLTSYFQQENIMNSANELLRRDIGDQTQKYLSANRKGCVVFGPPRITASVQRGSGPVTLYKKKGSDFILWDSKSIDKGFGASLVLSMNQQKVS